VEGSGRIGCGVNPEIAEAFNRRAGKWWSKLHRAPKVGPTARRVTREDSTPGYGRSRSTGSRIYTAWRRRSRSMRCGPRHTSEHAAISRLVYCFGFVDGWHKVGRRF
jgi:hypothetical protein